MTPIIENNYRFTHAAEQIHIPTFISNTSDKCLYSPVVLWFSWFDENCFDASLQQSFAEQMTCEFRAVVRTHKSRRPSLVSYSLLHVLQSPTVKASFRDKREALFRVLVNQRQNLQQTTIGLRVKHEVVIWPWWLFSNTVPMASLFAQTNPSSNL